MTRRWDPRDFNRTVEGGREIITPRGEPMCDFCLLRGPTWEYPATLMPLKGHPLVDATDDEWGACDECHDLIEAKRIGPLVERCVNGHIEAATAGVRVPPTPILRRELREKLLRFFDARTGPPRAYIDTRGTP